MKLTSDGAALYGPITDGTVSPGRPFTPPPVKPVKDTRPPRDWAKLHQFFSSHFTHARRQELARVLGLPPAVFDVLPCGYAPRDMAFTFAETDRTGKLVGINRRFHDGSKKMIGGSARGLYLPVGWNQGSGPILVVEGGSDTLACAAAGLQAVGRPSASGGVEHLVRLFADLPANREILVVGENDQKANGTWPGKEGAVAVARQLTERLGRRVRWSLPPIPHKDARAWLVATGKVVNRG